MNVLLLGQVMMLHHNLLRAVVDGMDDWMECLGMVHRVDCPDGVKPIDVPVDGADAPNVADSGAIFNDICITNGRARNAADSINVGARGNSAGTNVRARIDAAGTIKVRASVNGASTIKVRASVNAAGTIKVGASINCASTTKVRAGVNAADSINVRAGTKGHVRAVDGTGPCDAGGYPMDSTHDMARVVVVDVMNVDSVVLRRHRIPCRRGFKQELESHATQFSPR